MDQSEEFRKLYPLQVNFTMLSLVDCMNHFPVLVLGNFNTAEVVENGSSKYFARKKRASLSSLVKMLQAPLNGLISKII